VCVCSAVWCEQVRAHWPYLALAQDELIGLIPDAGVVDALALVPLGEASPVHYHCIACRWGSTLPWPGWQHLQLHGMSLRYSALHKESMDNLDTYVLPILGVHMNHDGGAQEQAADTAAASALLHQ
jgi:hypothetical protein